MKKIEIQQRVLQNGKPLDLDKFTWDEKTNTFSSKENNLVLDFNGVTNCTFNTGSDCIFKTCSNCIFKTGDSCTFKIRGNCTFNTGDNSICLFNKVRFFMDKKITYKTLTHSNEKGYILKRDNEDYFHYENETNEIVYVDGIVSKILSKKGNVLKVVNEGEVQESYIVSNGALYAHGNSIKEAKASLIYKISDRNTSEYKHFTLNTLVTFEEAVIMYRKITGSCESQTKVFAEANKFKSKKTIQEIIKITECQYNNNLLVQFFNK